nr:hypothetical protein [Tanacetum cinerariifolium]
MYFPSFDSPSLSLQPNLGYSPLNSINLAMENLFGTQEYYAGQGSGDSARGGLNLNEEANAYEEELREVRPMSRDQAKKKKVAFSSPRSESSCVAG